MNKADLRETGFSFVHFSLPMKCLRKALQLNSARTIKTSTFLTADKRGTPHFIRIFYQFSFFIWTQDTSSRVLKSSPAISFHHCPLKNIFYFFILYLITIESSFIFSTSRSFKPTSKSPPKTPSPSPKILGSIVSQISSINFLSRN